MDGFFMHSRNLLDRTACDGRLTAADRRVLDVAMRNTRSPGDPVALGLDFLMEKTGLYRSTIITSKRRLVELGYLIPCESGQRGLAVFMVVTGSVETTRRAETTGRPDATGTGSVETTCTGSVETTQIDTGNMETTACTHDDEKSPSGQPGDFGKLEPNSLAQGNQTTPPTPDPNSGDEGKREPPPPAKKAKPQKQYPGDLDADAEKLVSLYAELVKPKGYDNSGSRKTFLATARRLLTEGKPFADLERSIRNYQTSRQIQERQERDPEDAKKFRFGFQTFFGPKNEHWRDYVEDIPEEPLDECTEEWLREERRLGAELMAEEIRRRELGIPDWEECPA